MRLAAAFCLPLLLLAASTRASVPPMDHVMVIIMENHGYDEVRTLSYTSKLIARSATLTQSYAVTHPSLPNYIALWSGSTLGVTDDNCPPGGSPFSAANLGQACEKAGVTWRTYCEDLPSAGWAGCSSGGYRRKHAPWTDFGNLDHGNEHPYADLAQDIAANRLPALSFVVPNNCNSTHDCSLTVGDAWLAANVPALLSAIGPHGLLIVTWDEDDNSTGNHVLTVLAGPTVKAGARYSTTVNHYNVLRTICDALGVAPMAKAATAAPIDGVWLATTTVAHTSWGRLKAAYR
ncbi:MAG TPA: alkaline phosphatase family protein [Candidatus Krumholzibacteria bacterium]